LRRLSINFGSNNPRITLSAYTALTLNTAQIGARAELWVSGPDIPLVGKFDVDGHAYFDAILQFSPFAFDAAMGLGLSLLRNGETCCSIGGDLRIKGPNPYYLRGRVWAEILGIEVKVRVEKTFGQSVEDPPVLTDALALVLEAVRDRTLWESIPALTHRSGVTFADAGDGLVVDPVGGLQFAQRAVPLNVAIERLGTSRLANEFTTFGVRPVDASNATLPSTEARGRFATGQFFDLSDSERLAAPPTEEYVSGFALESSGALEYPAAAAVAAAYEYETVVLPANDAPSVAVGTRALPPGAREHWTAELQQRVRPRHAHYVTPGLASRRITVAPETFAQVSSQANARGVVPDAQPGSSRARRETFATQREARRGRRRRRDAGVVASFVADPQKLEGGS
jgi:hypothetical protein